MNQNKSQARAAAAPHGIATTRFAICSLGFASIVAAASFAVSSWFFGYNYFAL
jgi:hypothetical protein